MRAQGDIDRPAARLHSWLVNCGAAALNIVYPPQCPVCQGEVDAHGRLCAACWAQASFIGEPYCACCGQPFEFDMGDDALCLGCLARRPAYARARAALTYDEFSRRLVGAFKYGDRLDPARNYAAMMLRAGAALVREADIVAPVPLHWSRLFARRYNQSALLARHIGKDADKDYIPDLLKRVRRTASQGTLDRRSRLRNVRRAFAVPPRHEGRLQGRNVLLVDDVLTTGATAENCAQALYKAGAQAVNVLTLARVVLPHRAPI